MWAMYERGHNGPRKNCLISSHSCERFFSPRSSLTNRSRLFFRTFNSSVNINYLLLNSRLGLPVRWFFLALRYFGYLTRKWNFWFPLCCLPYLYQSITILFWVFGGSLETNKGAKNFSRYISVLVGVWLIAFLVLKIQHCRASRDLKISQQGSLDPQHQLLSL